MSRSRSRCVLTTVVVSMLIVVLSTVGNNVSSYAQTEIGMKERACDSYCAEVVKAYHVPGMAVSIATSDGVVFSGQYGECRSENDRFFIGSESKSFTALAIMQLVEERLISLDEDVSRYVSEAEYGKTLTIRMLLNQTSGFTQYQRSSERKITDSYGEYQYSNANYELLGEVIESVSGLSYSEYMSKHVFAPLGMNDTYADARYALVKGMLGGHLNFYGFNVNGRDTVPNAGAWFHEPAGYIASTSADMAKYLQMYLRGGVGESGARVLSEDGIRQMYSDTASQNYGYRRYGFGLMTDMIDGEQVVYHNGLVEEYRTYFLFVPDRDIAISVMINGEDYLVGNDLTADICFSLYKLAQGRTPETVNASKYVVRHLSTDIKYLAMLAVAVVVFVSALISNGSRLRVSCIAGMILPIAITQLVLLLGGTPMWVIRDYVPDFYLIILISAGLALLGAIVALIRILFGVELPVKDNKNDVADNRIQKGKESCV